jgi:Rieske Fe-S protein
MMRVFWTLTLKPSSAAIAVTRGVPAPTNLTVPPYRYINEGTILIGADTAGNS